MGAWGVSTCACGVAAAQHGDPPPSQSPPPALPLPQHLKQQEGQGGDSLVDLPEHCLRETAGEKVMVASGLLSILLQLATAYIALSLSFRLPVKGE